MPITEAKLRKRLGSGRAGLELLEIVRAGCCVVVGRLEAAEQVWDSRVSGLRMATRPWQGWPGANVGGLGRESHVPFDCASQAAPLAAFWAL